ncbi:TRAFAC clade GTPase domain-containing protein [Geodermatophilus sp. CPCC 205506]|uniref:TRAFAC clade GTPase domain-containing protein n=1 Tax=Geodermatophilus sp. CPCC 205506 TaxID=2936596 RepID=UPI003EE8482C
MRRRVCPRCLEPLSTPVWRDARGAPTRPPVERRTRWQRFLDPLRTESAPAPTPRDAAGAAAANVAPTCPRGHRLPPDYLDRPTVVVGLVGLTGASKSTYLTVLIDLLHEGALAPLGISVEMDEDSAARFDDYRYRLMVQRRQLPLTLPLLGEGSSPEPFTLVLRGPGRNGTERSLNLVFFDASGEQLYRSEDMGQYGKFLYAASSILVILSPGVFPRLRHLADPGEESMGLARHTQMVVNLANLLRTARNLHPDSHLEGVSTAVVLSKADKLRGVTDFPTEALRDTDLTAAPLSHWFEDVRSNSSRLVDFLELKGGSNLLTAVLGRLPRPTVHAVSATGADARDGGYPEITPVGCLDPLLVLLARHGFLSAEGLDPEETGSGLRREWSG